MPLTPPPDDPAALAGFPRRQLRGTRLFRLLLHRDPQTSELRHPFFFSSAAEASPLGGRYDLPAPHGSCYLAEAAVAAWLETFRGTLVVDRGDLRRRRLLATRVPRSLPAANLSAPAARGFGITGEIHTAADYRLPRRWAHRLQQAGARALSGKVRHDPGVEHGSVTLFDATGAHDPYGWRWRLELTRPDEDRELLAAAARYGFTVADPPYDVTTLPQPHGPSG